MQPLLTLIRVRNDGVSSGRGAGWSAGGVSVGIERLQMPFPPQHSARDFALDFMDAVSRARGEWILVVSDHARPEEACLDAVARRIAAPGEAQGLFLRGRGRTAVGADEDVFPRGFGIDAFETAKARHPWLSDPARLLSFFALRASLARSLAEDLVRLVDPLPGVLSFAAAVRLDGLVRQGLIPEAGDARVLHEPAPEPETVANAAMRDFEAGRAHEALRALDYFRFAWGENPQVDLHRMVLNAKVERFWLAGHSVRRFLRRNKENPHGLKLAEALAALPVKPPAGYASARPLLDLVDLQGDAEGERFLFERMAGLHEQAVALAVGDFPLRPGLAMALASLGSPRKVVALSPFHARTGERSAWGRCLDLWKAAASRFDLDDNAEASEAVRERLASWGDAPRPDMLFVSLDGDEDHRDAVAAAFALLNEGGLLVVEGPSAGRSAAWRFWIESAEPALADRGRAGNLAYGRKTQAPLGGWRVPMTFPELWRRSRLPYPYERTMLTFERFRNAFILARNVDLRKLPGAIVECGVWKGGCSASMLLAIQESGSKRPLWAFDSFQGLPRPTAEDGEFAKRKSDEWGGGGCETTEEDFRETLFGIARLKDENVHIRKGWFQDTLPRHKNEIGPIAILRLDGDWYESVMVCLEHLYELVVPGGYILIDDYGFWEGAQKATDEFREKLGIRSPLITTDHDERYWIKLDEKAVWTPVAGEHDLAVGGRRTTGYGARGAV